jgi:hypothetical protein
MKAIVMPAEILTLLAVGLSTATSCKQIKTTFFYLFTRWFK